LKLKPTVAVVTNIEPEHMDTYGTEEKLVQAFVDFCDRADVAVLCADDPNVLLVEARTLADVFTYGLEDGADSYCKEYAPQGQGMAFDATIRGGVLEDVVVALPGVHYVSNSLAALTVASLLKVDMGKAVAALAEFKGVGRRFTKLGRFHGADIIDDYGHHPTEIATTLDAARGVYTGKVVAVIQPHRYTRLRDLMDAFADCTKAADVVVLLPVYAAGEAPLPGVDSEVLGHKMALLETGPEVQVVDGEASLFKALHHLDLAEGDVVVCLGAGNITDYARHLVEHVH
jgi:UDP-N-acetylmuramate--alanine ligase